MAGMEGLARLYMDGADTRKLAKTQLDGADSATRVKQPNVISKERNVTVSSEVQRDNADNHLTEQRTTETKRSASWKPHFRTHDSTTKHHGHGKATLPNPTRIDVTQSKWIHSPDDTEREIVTLVIKSEHESEGSRKSFRWSHHQRNLWPVAFSEFQSHVAHMEGLYGEERAAATLCLKEVRRQRKLSARGCYFRHTIHQAEAIDKKGNQQTPVLATFMSFPIFALLPDQSGNAIGVSYPSSRDIRNSDHHPVRSLLQYTNIFAIDSIRDRSQVVTKQQKVTDADAGFIQVPEMWALVINMYTLITCAPFSVKDLLARNIETKYGLVTSYRGIGASVQDNRNLVRYRGLDGTFHDLECRQWQSLVTKIARIEDLKDELQSLLDDPQSGYNIVDLKYQPIDRARWNNIVDSQYEHTEYVHLRLLRVATKDVLNLSYAQRKQQAYTSTSMILTALKVVLQQLQQKYIQKVKKRKTSQEADLLKKRMADVKRAIVDLQRSLYFNRLALYAARYHLINPPRAKTRSSSTKTQVPQHVAVKQPRRRNSSPDHQSMLPLSPMIGAAAKPENSPVATKSHVQDQHVQRGSADPVDGSGLPKVLLNDEPIEPPIPPGRGTASQVKFSMPQDLHHPFVDQQTLSKPARDSTGSSTLSAPVPITDVEAQTTEHGIPFPPRRLKRSMTGTPDTVFEHEIQYPAGVFGSAPLVQNAVVKSRRHSLASTGLLPAILDASPPRRPLDANDDSAIRVSSRKLRPPLTDWVSAAAGMFIPPIKHTSRPPVAVGNQTNDDVEPSAWNLTAIAAKRTRVVDHLNPFFEWRSARSKSTTSKDHEAPQDAPDGHLRHVQNEPADTSTIAGDAMHILESIDDLIANGNYFGQDPFPITPKDYHDIKPSSPEEITNSLEREHADLYRSAPDAELPFDIESHRAFFEVKMTLFLTIHGLLRCFVRPERHGTNVISRIWGVVYNVCKLSAKEDHKVTLTHRHELQYVKVATLRLEEIENQCCNLLKDVRPDSGEDPTAVQYGLPQVLLPAFRNIVVYLLCIWRATTTFGVEPEHVTIAHDSTLEKLEEADYTFERMRDNAAADDDQFAGEESLCTADTLLALLVENAFDISHWAGSSTGGPHFDLRHVYSRYTSYCISRAQRMASTRFFKDVQLLVEEIEAINTILENQKRIFEAMFEKRESPRQKLDYRVERRTLAYLEDTQHHFRTLLGHAKQAQFWTSHSVAVREEDSSKALYVFTAVTVIFLPLSFVAGLLGMNTQEIRSTKDKQWLFWCIAVPFTACVLIICLCIVGTKFRVRKRWTVGARWVLGRCWRLRRMQDWEEEEFHVSSHRPHR